MNRASNSPRVALWVALSLGLLTVALAATVVVLGHPTLDNAASQETANTSNGHENKSVKSRLFDFANYKRLFKKAYSGIIEELVRQKYFFARAFRVFITAMKYRYKQALYYFSLNHLSDATPKELDSMRNHQLEAQLASLQSSANRINDKLALDSELPALDSEINPGDNIEESLRELVGKNQNEPALKELDIILNGQQDNQESAASSSSSSSPSSSEDKLRELPLDKLINTGRDVQAQPEVKANRVSIASLDSKPLEPASDNWFVKRGPVKFYWLAGTAGAQFDSVNKEESKSANQHADQLADEVFVDLRKESNCFSLPRDQGLCGCCYAFSIISIMEWLHCMQTGELVAFSEQYMLDCGKQYDPENFLGCIGGSDHRAATFAHNFGLELAANYPYTKSEGQCPFSQPLETTGYMQAQMTNLIFVWERDMDRMVRFGPIFVSIAIAKGFQEYGGGVHGQGCDNSRADHGIVLIGHGRESGREYWLLRNSFSSAWGEQGHYKLDKAAGCIFQKVGYILGTKNGYQLDVQFRINPYYDSAIVRKMKIDLQSAPPTVIASTKAMISI